MPYTRGEGVRILHLIYDDLSNPWLGGGGAIGTSRISKILVDKGHSVTVVTGNYPNAREKEARDGVFYWRIGAGATYLLSRLTYSLCVPRVVKRLDYDILVDDFSAFSPSFSPLYAKKPVVAVVRNLFSTHALKKYKLLGLLPFLSERLGLKLYQNFVAVSPSLAQQLREIMPKKRIKMVPNSVEQSLFSLRASERDYILFLGRIDIYQKGIDTLLEAFKEVVRGKEGIKLIIAGGGKDAGKLKDLISKFGLGDEVELAGRVYGQSKEELLLNCLFVCMPSRFESFGRVAIEASACEKAVVGTKIPGLWDTIKEGETGLLIKPGDPEDLSQTMMRVINDRELRKSLGKAGRRWARNFSPEKVATMMEEFYLDCLKG